ncbi:4Fe-4S binding protein [Sulfurimonas sp. HSL3-2]|uniref:4Fe-4S binding protein n=1 Tax=Hydrocurvibacter mobilis TaxID=3131936 RepID=UPI0031F7EDF7
MVDFIKRDKNDIFGKPVLGFFFKNQKFLLALRIVVTATFFYALYFGFAYPGKENIFTGALFWGVFWALFMVATLPTFGRIFCGVCPHGFLGKYITRFGLKKTMPEWMQNRYIGIFLLVIGWWGVYYTFSGFWNSPLVTAAMFTVMTLLAFVLYYIYKDMSYCKSICPIGTLTRAYDKLSFTKLETYTDSCKDCRTFECATACSYNLKPFTFAKKNQNDDCTLCMDCSAACEAVKFKFTKPSEQLFSKFKTLNAEVWTYILILGSIPVSMTFAHGLNRSSIADSMIWNKTAVYLGLSEYAGGFAFLYALVLTVFFSVLGVFLASKVLKKDYAGTFSTLGYGYAPLFILGSLGHTLESFFTHEYQTIVQGFAQAFGFAIEVAPLAHRGDAWLHYFGLLKWIGVIWAFILIYKRLKLIEATKVRKIFGYIFGSLLVFFFIGINIYTGYVFKTYGAKQGGHGAHSSKGMHRPSSEVSKGFTKYAGGRGLKKVVLKEDEPIYFSFTNPNDRSKSAFTMGMFSHGGKKTVPTKKLWLVYGDELNDAKSVPQMDVQSFYYDTKKNLKETKIQDVKGTASFSFEIPNNGYYNIFAKNETLKSGTLFYRVAKMEYLHASHGSEESYTQSIKERVQADKSDIDLVLLKNEDENSFFYRHSMGDELRFLALLHNKPLTNADITVHMSSGWNKHIKTDAEGIAKFHIIRDYFPVWKEFDKRHKEELLVTLTYTTDEVGKFDGKEYKNIKYILTYPASFYPNNSDYASYAYALLLAVLTLLVSGIIIYRFRKNRTRPFSEVRHVE